jgi:periplasmic protein CpxP/Spy
MLKAIFRLVMAASLAAAGLTPSGVSSRAAAMAAAMMDGPAPRHQAPPLLPVQAPAPAPNVEANIAQLHQRLQITPAQEARFEALANVMRQNARMMPNAPPPTDLDPIQGLRFAIQAGEHELIGLKRLLPLLEALYASLSPMQQRTADQVFRQGPGE